MIAELTAHNYLCCRQHLNPENVVMPTFQELEAIINREEAKRAKRAEQMPTESDALNIMFEAYLRLKELGWNDAIYCPKDGKAFQAIEAGSTGISQCYYAGNWPKGSWYSFYGADVYPSRPILFKPNTETAP